MYDKFYKYLRIFQYNYVYFLVWSMYAFLIVVIPSMRWLMLRAKRLSILDIDIITIDKK